MARILVLALFALLLIAALGYGSGPKPPATNGWRRQVGVAAPYTEDAV